jgi:dTDP-4-amino-4,6-dideoxygalactose transaminase
LTIWKYPLGSPELGNEELEEVTNVIKSGWLSMGKYTKKLEDRFAAKVKSAYSLATSNCTSSLQLSLVALGIGKGDEVIIPAMTYVATASAVVASGATPIFADSISQTDFTISPDDIERKISSKTRAIIPVHYGGFSASMDRIMEIARKYNLRVIEDCAHAPLAKFNGKYVGTFGDAGCFSFYSSKNMTCGEGGMVVTKSPALHKKMKILRTHGVTKSLTERENAKLGDYDVVEYGFNFNIDDIRAAIAVIQLGKLEKFNEKRRSLFMTYRDILRDSGKVKLVFGDRDISEAAPHLVTIVVKDEPREKLEKRLSDGGVQTGRHYELIPNFSRYRDKNFFSRVENIDNIITLPLHTKLSTEDISYICSLIL